MKKTFTLLTALFLTSLTTLHAELPAAMVRLAKPPIVDGDADDWKNVTAVHEIRDQRGEVVARFRIGWDDQACYALFNVRDDSPLKNATTAIQELFKGGDAISLCLGTTDGTANQRIVAGPFGSGFSVMAMRPKWPEKSPYRYFTSASGELVYEHVAELAGAQVAAKASSDGYVLELALPWKSLGMKAGAGTTLTFDAQVVFSNPGGTANAATAWWRSVGSDTSSVWDIVAEARLHPGLWGRVRCFINDPGPRIAVKTDAKSGSQGVPIRFELPRPAEVSLVIKDASGWIVAEPIRCTQYPAGKHVFTWDGRDRLGLPLPAGKYQTLIGYWDGIRTDFVASVGNSGRPPFVTKDGLGSIGGAHGGIGGLAADATGIYMGQVSEEGQPCLRKIDPATGKALWFSSVGVFAGCHILAADGRNVWSLVIGSGGKTVKLMHLDAATGRPVPFGGKKGNPSECQLNERSFDAIAVAGGKVYLSEPGKDRLAVIDNATGKLLPEIPIEKPSGLCRLDDQTLLVGSGGRVLRLDLASGKSQELVGGLARPRALALDGDGVLYVSDLGTSQQIKTYQVTAAGAKPLTAIGVAGGRPSAVEKWNPLQFRDVSHLAIGPDGNLWCAERWDVPRRFIKLTRDGKHLEDFYGASGFATMGIDLDDPALIYYTSSQYSPHIVQARVDFEQYRRDPADPWKGWKIEAIHELTHPGTDPKPDLVSKPMKGGYQRLVVFTGTNGVRYLWKPGDPGACLFRWDGRRWLPAATVSRNPSKDNKQSYWSDLSGDGAVQTDELAGGEVQSGHWMWIDRDLTLHGRFGSLKPKSIDARGVPVYQGGAYTALWKDSRPWPFYVDQSNYDQFGAPPTADGSRWFVVNAGAEPSRNFWDRASETRLFRVGPDGKVQFVIGHHDGTMPRNGDNQMLMNLVGEMDGVLFASEVWSCFTAYTHDGLTLGWVNRGPDGRIANYGPASVAMENVAPGFLYKHPKTGQRCLAFSTTEDVRVISVDGIWGDQITRLNGAVDLGSSQPRAIEPAPGNCLIPISTWVHGNGGRYMGIDGYNTEWDPAVASLSIRNGKALVADLRLRRDNGCLQIMAEVVDPQGWAALSANAGTNSAVFGSFPAVELMLGPARPNRKTAAAGDTRIVLSAQRKPDGSIGGLALACRPLSPPLVPGAVHRPRDRSGNLAGLEPAKAEIDWSGALKPIPGAQVTVRERFDRTGWRLEAEIPLAALPDLVKTASMRVQRQNGVNENREVPDLMGAFKFNAAVWVGSADNVRRLPWMADGFSGSDPAVMSPAAWGMANAAVAIRWNEVDGASSYRLYRSSSTDAASAVAVKTISGAMSASDLPGIGDFWYWLAPVGAAGEGQWLGPVQMRESTVVFPSCAYLPPVAFADLAKTPLDVFPGHQRLLNITGVQALKVSAPPNVVCQTIKREGGAWMLVVTPKGVVAPGMTVGLRDAGAKGGPAATLPLMAAPVPATAHGAVCAALTNANGKDNIRQQVTVTIDSSAPGDGAEGKPAAVLRWQGRGDLPLREIGRHGFALIRWKGDPQHRRVVKAPFVDTFGTFKIGSGDFGNLALILDGDNPAKAGRIPYGALDSRDPGSQFTIRLQADDQQPHVVTVLADKRGRHAAPPVRWLVSDPATKRQWILREYTGDQGVNALQFRFIGAVDLTAVTTAYSDEFYNRVGISAIFLD
jgi:hypothetical protein